MIFHEVVKLAHSWNFEIIFCSKYNSLSPTFLCVNRQTQDHGAPAGSKGNYLEKAAMLQFEEGMLITLVDSQDAASSCFFCLDCLWAN